MKTLAYGLHDVIPDNAKAALGARGILKNGIVDIPQDRFDATVFSESDEDKLLFGSWYRKTAVKWIEKEAKSLYTNEDKLCSLDDGIFHVRMNPNASYGYLYITCWME